MFAGLKLLVTVGVMLCMISKGFAQDHEGVEEAGTAYEFSGLTKFFTVPSKRLFGDKELLNSDIVDGYRIRLTTGNWNCIRNTREKVVLTSRPRGWWSQPIYREIRLTDQNVPDEAIVVLMPPSRSLTEIGCTENIPAEKFVVDEKIAQRLRAPTNPMSDGG